jgi:hypothetical protein
MATLYLDFENGNDNYAGSSFALLASGIDGTIVTSTFTSVTASFPNDGSLIGQYLSIFNGSIYAIYNITAWVSATSLTIAAISGGTALSNQAARQYYIGGRWKNITTGATAVRTIPGDTIRIMGSPAPTSLGQNGVWTSQALQATKSITSSTNATPISVTSTAHGYATGDTVVITGHTTNTNANGTWEITNTGANTFTLDGSVGNGVGGATGTVRLRSNTRVKLATAVTQNIASTGPGRAAWTASANVTATLSTITKQHVNSDSIAIASGFSTGLAAYWATPGTLDLSGYQQVSFWILQTAGTIGAAGAVDLRLCSDAAGVTAVNTISIPNLAGIGRWMPVTVDLGTDLGSSIQSIALYVNTDNAAQIFLLSNIIACKASSAADSLTLTSLIGKNTTGETFWGIQSINGTRVMLDADTNASPVDTTMRGYYGTSETVTTWKRETIKLGPGVSSSTALQTIQESGTDGSPITYSGGWDRTAMSTQTLGTWLDGVNGNGYAINIGSTLFTSLSGLAFVRFNNPVNTTSNAYNTFSILHMGNNASQTFLGLVQLELLHYVANSSSVLLGNSSTYRRVYAKIGNVVSNGNYGIDVYGGDTVIDSSSGLARIANNNFGGLTLRGVSYVKNVITENNDSTGILYPGSAYIQAYLSNCTINEATEVSIGQAYASVGVNSQNHDSTPNNHKIFVESGLISSATDQRKTPSGISWKMQPTNSRRNSFQPLTLSLAKVACAANSLVTIKAWMRRTNTGLTMRLVCKGGQIAGVTSDVVSAMAAAADTWEELTITFTPTETGVVEITAEAWGGTTFSGWVDDMTISQA